VSAHAGNFETRGRNDHAERTHAALRRGRKLLTEIARDLGLDQASRSQAAVLLDTYPTSETITRAETLRQRGRPIPTGHPRHGSGSVRAKRARPKSVQSSRAQAVEG
jgi:hypothetical protein